MTITQIIFDCDGVLIDSEHLIAQVESELRTELGFPITPEAYVKKYVGLSTRSAEYREGLKGLPENYRELCKTRVDTVLRTKLTAISGAAEFIDSLSVDTAVASTSSPDELEFTLKIAGLYDRFAGRIFSVSMVDHPKPAPDVYLFAAKQTGHEPPHCLVIEDSKVGVTAAHAAGMPVIGFTAAGHAHDGTADSLKAASAFAIANSYAELPKLLDQHSLTLEKNP